MVDARILATLLEDMWSRWVLVQFLDLLSCKTLLLSLPLKLNTWQLSRQARRSNGCAIWCMNLVFPFLASPLCSLTTSLRFPWPRTLNTIVGWSNWIFATTGFKMWYRNRLSHLSSSPPLSKLLIFSPNHWLQPRWGSSVRCWDLVDLWGVIDLQRCTIRGECWSWMFVHLLLCYWMYFGWLLQLVPFPGLLHDLWLLYFLVFLYLPSLYT